MIFAKNIVGRVNILTNLSSNSPFVLSQLERQLCSVQGKMFQLSAKKNLASKEFIDFFMQSRTAAYFDLPYDRTQWLGEENLLYDVLEEYTTNTPGIIYNPESLFWMGYLYRYWHFFTKQTSKEIGKICNAEMLNTLYPAYHTLDCSMAVERILEATENIK